MLDTSMLSGYLVITEWHVLSIWADLFVVYLTMMSVVQTIQHQIIVLLMNNEL